MNKANNGEREQILKQQGINITQINYVIPQ